MVFKNNTTDTFVPNVFFFLNSRATTLVNVWLVYGDCSGRKSACTIELEPYSTITFEIFFYLQKEPYVISKKKIYFLEKLIFLLYLKKIT